MPKNITVLNKGRHSVALFSSATFQTLEDDNLI